MGVQIFLHGMARSTHPTKGTLWRPVGWVQRAHIAARTHHNSRETHHPIPNKLSHNLGDFSFWSHHFSASPGASARQA